MKDMIPLISAEIHFFESNGLTDIYSIDLLTLMQCLSRLYCKSDYAYFYNTGNLKIQWMEQK